MSISMTVLEATETEPLVCPECEGPNIPVMSMACQHSHCLGCIRSRVNILQRERPNETNVCKFSCPFCGAANAYRWDDGIGSHINLKACEIMQATASLKMELKACDEEHEIKLKRCKDNYVKKAAEMEAESKRLQTETEKLKAALSESRKELAAMRDAVTDLKEEVWTEDSNNKFLASATDKRRQSDVLMMDLAAFKRARGQQPANNTGPAFTAGSATNAAGPRDLICKFRMSETILVAEVAANVAARMGEDYSLANGPVGDIDDDYSTASEGNNTSEYDETEDRYLLDLDDNDNERQGQRRASNPSKSQPRKTAQVARGNDDNNTDTDTYNDDGEDEEMAEPSLVADVDLDTVDEASFHEEDDEDAVSEDFSVHSENEFSDYDDVDDDDDEISHQSERAGEDPTWTMKFEQLKVYKKNYGHCRVPINCPMGQWLEKQRVYCKNARNSNVADRLEKLVALDIEWAVEAENAQKEAWEKEFGKLLNFKEEHGHCDVPLNHGNLGAWLRHQRDIYNKKDKHCRLNQEHKDKLESLGIRFKSSGAERK